MMLSSPQSPAKPNGAKQVSYVITYRPKGGRRSLVISDHDSSEREARTFCQSLAEDMETVVLYSLAEDGLLAPVVQFRQTRTGKVRAHKLDTEPLSPPKARQPRANGHAPEPEADEPEPVEEDVDLAETDEEPEEETYDGYCVKCKEHRTFHGHIEETANGRRMAKGNCPVCGTKMNRILKNIPHEEQDSYHTPDDPEPEPDLTEKVEEAVVEAAEGETAEDVAAAAAAIAIEFSEVAEQAEAPKESPRKRLAKKAEPAAAKARPRKAAKEKDDDGRTPNQRAAANTVKAKCPQCGQSVDVIERAGIAIFTLHPNESKGLDRCPGSTTVASS